MHPVIIFADCCTAAMEVGCTSGLFVAGAPRPEHACQGRLGNCALVCAMASLANGEDGARDIRQLFAGVGTTRATDELPPRFVVSLAVGGWYRSVTVDDSFPLDASGDRIGCHCHSHPGELWPRLLEKAWASLNGGFDRLVRGDALTMMHRLCGFPFTRLDASRFAGALERGATLQLFLGEALCGALIVLLTPNVDAVSAAVAAQYTAAGLVLEHSYSVLGVDAAGDDAAPRLLLRDPWGKPIVQSETVDCVGTGTSANDEPLPPGTFWMRWPRVCQLFHEGGVVHRRRDWHDYRVQQSFTNGAPALVILLHVTAPMTAFLCAYQQLSEHPDCPPRAPLKLVLHDSMDGVAYTQWRAADVDALRPVCGPERGGTPAVSACHGMRVTLEPREHPYVMHTTLQDVTRAELACGIQTERPLGEKVPGDRVWFAPGAAFACHRRGGRLDRGARLPALVAATQYRPPDGTAIVASSCSGFY